MSTGQSDCNITNRVEAILKVHANAWPNKADFDVMVNESRNGFIFSKLNLHGIIKSDASRAAAVPLLNRIISQIGQIASRYGWFDIEYDIVWMTPTSLQIWVRFF